MDNQLQITPLEQSFKMKFTDMDELLDFLEIKMHELCDLVDRPVKERISPNLYTREAHAKQGDLIISLKHKREHQFIVSKGSCAVFTEGEGWKLIEAPFHGLTKVGTRRLLYVLDDLIFTTLHPVPDDITLDNVRDYVIEERDNKILEKGEHTWRGQQ